MAGKSLLQDHARKLSGQLTTGEAPEPHEALPPDQAFLAPAAAYVIRRRITVPVLPFPVGAVYVFRILEAIHLSAVEDTKYGPAHVCMVESPSGEVRVLIANTVLQSELDRAFPDDGYVGAWFEVTKMPRREGKNYADFSIVEIEPPVRPGLETAA
jgi:hypothetical protein